MEWAGIDLQAVHVGFVVFKVAQGQDFSLRVLQASLCYCHSTIAPYSSSSCYCHSTIAPYSSSSCYCHSTIAPYSSSSWYCSWHIRYKDQRVNVSVPIRRLTRNLSNVSVRKRLVVLSQSVFRLRSSRFWRHVVFVDLLHLLGGAAASFFRVEGFLHCECTKLSGLCYLFTVVHGMTQ
jgi:hypothetical protein